MTGPIRSLMMETVMETAVPGMELTGEALHRHREPMEVTVAAAPVMELTALAQERRVPVRAAEIPMEAVMAHP